MLPWEGDGPLSGRRLPGPAPGLETFVSITQNWGSERWPRVLRFTNMPLTKGRLEPEGEKNVY